MQKRCAIYTRTAVRSEASVIVQRENAERLIEARSDEGWITVLNHYDDSGFSGCDMERPALQRLFKDIEQGLIDVVVIRDTNCLSRSIADAMSITTFLKKNNVTLMSA